jgi:hypothetical protein
MNNKLEIHPDFIHYLKHKDEELIQLYTQVRTFILDLYPDSYELLYHTHALTSLYTVTEKMGDAFCMIPIYTHHLNLAFNKGTLLDDPHQLLQGTGKWMRHIPITTTTDYDTDKVRALLEQAIQIALEDAHLKTPLQGTIISKIKR